MWGNLIVHISVGRKVRFGHLSQRDGGLTSSPLWVRIDLGKRRRPCFEMSRSMLKEMVKIFPR